MDSSTLSAMALESGFALSGVTTPQPPPHSSFFETWLADGFHAGMAYLASARRRALRANPAALLPGCRSIICLGIPYPPPATPPPPPTHTRIAGYAQGDDYHVLLRPRLKTLARRILAAAGSPGAPFTVFTDASPILERDLAQRAGLGWAGKNTCLISPRIGSCFFLAEIFLPIELEPSTPFTTDRCGSCTRCLHACPARCLLPGRRLDARACISYLTIENTGPIPPALRLLLGNRVFGCDDCQQACPWNRFAARPAHTPAIFPLDPQPAPLLVDELALTPAEFESRYARSPLRRAGYIGYLRNIAVALGNSRDRSVVPALGRCLQRQPAPLVRAHTAWALGRLGGPAARRLLNAARRRDPDPAVQSEIAAALSS